MRGTQPSLLSVEIFRNGRFQERMDPRGRKITIGADPDCDIVLDDPLVSWRHAEVYIDGMALRYEDHSSNGSFVASRRVSSVLLSPGDCVDVPPFQLRFVIAQETSTLAPVSRATPTPGIVPLRVSPSGTKMLDRGQVAVETRPTLGLEVVQGPAPWSGKKWPLQIGSTVIGRGRTAGIAIDLTTLSRDHAKIILASGSTIQIIDLNSRNGILISGKRVTEAVLEVGSRFSLGPELTIRIIRWAATRPSSSPELALDISRHRGGRAGDVAILALEGDVYAYTYGEFKRALDQALDERPVCLLIDLADTRNLDDNGIAVLSSAAGDFAAARIQLAICGLAGKARDNLAASRVDEVHYRGRIFPNRAVAIQKWESGLWPRLTN